MQFKASVDVRDPTSSSAGTRECSCGPVQTWNHLGEELINYGIRLGGLILAMLVEGLVVWILVPFEVLVWIVGCYWFLQHGADLGRFLGWLDTKLWLLLLGVIFLATAEGQKLREVPSIDIDKVTHWLGGGLTSVFRDQ